MILSRRSFFFGAPAVLVLGHHMRIRPTLDIVSVEGFLYQPNWFDEEAAVNWIEEQMKKVYPNVSPDPFSQNTRILL